MSELTVYEKPTCSTCQRTVELLREREVEFDRVDYFNDRLTEAQLRHLLALQRPIVERGDRAVLARPPEKVLELLG